MCCAGLVLGGHWVADGHVATQRLNPRPPPRRLYPHTCFRLPTVPIKSGRTTLPTTETQRHTHTHTQPNTHAHQNVSLTPTTHTLAQTNTNKQPRPRSGPGPWPTPRTRTGTGLGPGLGPGPKPRPGQTPGHRFGDWDLQVNLSRVLSPSLGRSLAPSDRAWALNLGPSRRLCLCPG